MCTASNAQQKVVDLKCSGGQDYTTLKNSRCCVRHLQDKYGMILTHRWFGDGYLVVGFTSGWVVVISTHNKEMSEEVRVSDSLRLLKCVPSDCRHCPLHTSTHNKEICKEVRVSDRVES
jgi:hypothetical protein